MSKTFSLGVDVGSTTVKTVILDDEDNILTSNYQRHFSKVRETVLSQLKEIQKNYPDTLFRMCITGSAGLGLANNSGLPFVQEVYGAFIAVKRYYPNTDVVVELGGEDAKIIFLTGGVEQRMNGSCAGGTGAFIDQMATLLGISIQELDEMSLQAEKLYPIASRCGVFAKSDVQPLLNQGAKREDIAASIFQAVVDQTVSGLAQGRRVKGKVLFLGGPLSFLKGLQNAFLSTLKLGPQYGELSKGEAVFPEQAPVFMAMGCALYAKDNTEPATLEKICYQLQTAPVSDNIITGQRLFTSRHAYESFIKRHASHDLEYADIKTYTGEAYLGVDAGSTTTKLILITPEGHILYQHYSSNKGRPLDKVSNQLKEIYALKNPQMTIRASAVTGYGEDLIRAGLGVDLGIVETVAHFKAAQYFCPNVDFIIDIGGQDIKCFKIKNNAIDSIMLNEACSSGCGSFIQTFAQALGYDVSDFSKLGLFAERPVDLGSRCTVFMNSNVKQAQKDGATVEDISAGLSASIIKNAIYKVIRARSVEDLGENIVVQGGTFLNDAVLRSFEQELGRNVIRPAIAGLMGAFGAALYAKEHVDQVSSSALITSDALEHFSYESKAAVCGGCGSKCSLTIIRFDDGHKFISGNRCEKGAGLPKRTDIPCLYEYKYERLFSVLKNQPENAIASVGLPLALGFYEQLPFWYTLFATLGFKVVTSEESTRQLYFKGQHTIPSDTVCYPAKLAHGHIVSLLEKNVDFIFYPCESYNIDEGQSDNHYNCPVVAYYPELLKANISKLNDHNFFYPYIDINLKKHAVSVLLQTLKAYHLSRKAIAAAYDKAMDALHSYRHDIIFKGQEIINQARKNHQKIIVLAGRPYHIDPEINHGIHKLITSLGMAVITEDSISHLGHTPKLDVLNQWTYHARLYKAAQYVTTQPDMQLVQLVSFGCGIDAITTDEVRSILEEEGKLYTQLKIDEISNLGAARIRMRSLAAAMEEKDSNQTVKI